MKISTGWITHAWKKADADARIIQLQKYFIIILSLVTLALFTGWITTPSRLTIYIPPDIQNGATMKVNNIPEALIYSFAYQIWQEINYWPNESGDEYKKNILTYSSYLTPAFKAELLISNNDLKASGQLQRLRLLQGLNGAAYDNSYVKKLSNNTWQVNLFMRLTELNNNQTVKDIEIVYPLKVTRSNVSAEHNPYGLSLAGFVSDPSRQKTYI